MGLCALASPDDIARITPQRRSVVDLAGKAAWALASRHPDMAADARGDIERASIPLPLARIALSFAWDLANCGRAAGSDAVGGGSLRPPFRLTSVETRYMALLSWKSAEQYLKLMKLVLTL